MKRNQIVLIFLAVALLASIGLNVILFRKGRSYYAQLSMVQLDPVGLNHYPVADDQLPDSPSSQLRVVLLGDSRARSWPFPSEMPRFEFYNRGIGNQTSTQVVARFQEHVTPLQPDLIIIQVGVNDLKTIPIFPERREEIVANCKANIERLVNQSLALDAVVVLTTIFPLGEVPLERRLFWSGDVAVAIDEVNEFISSLEQEEVLVLNTGVVLADDEGQVRKAYSRDLLHLTETGYEALNEKLVIVLRDVVP